MINLKTAKSLDLDMPPTVLARADEVIDTRDQADATPYFDRTFTDQSAGIGATGIFIMIFLPSVVLFLPSLAAVK